MGPGRRPLHSRPSFSWPSSRHPSRHVPHTPEPPLTSFVRPFHWGGVDGGCGSGVWTVGCGRGVWQWGVDSGVWTGGVDGGAVGTLASGLGPGGTGPAATESQAERLSPWVFVLPCGMPLHVPWLCGLLRRPLVLEAATWESRGGTEAGDPGPWLSPRAECRGTCLGPWEPAEPGLAPSWASHAGAGSLSPCRPHSGM